MKTCCNLPCAAAAMGTGVAVENIKERPLDSMSCFQGLLSIQHSDIVSDMCQ